jgi:hypothetical protein
LQPTAILGVFSNQCSCTVRGKVPITHENWKSVPKDLKDHVWGETKRWFMYPEQGYDEKKCKAHVMYLAGKALQNFRYNLNKEYMQTRETPFTCYS